MSRTEESLVRGPNGGGGGGREAGGTSREVRVVRLREESIAKVGVITGCNSIVKGKCDFLRRFFFSTALGMEAELFWLERWQ